MTPCLSPSSQRAPYNKKNSGKYILKRNWVTFYSANGAAGGRGGQGWFLSSSPHSVTREFAMDTTFTLRGAYFSVITAETRWMWNQRGFRYALKHRSVRCRCEGITFPFSHEANNPRCAAQAYRWAFCRCRRIWAPSWASCGSGTPGGRRASSRWGAPHHG